MDKRNRDLTKDISVLQKIKILQITYRKSDIRLSGPIKKYHFTNKGQMFFNTSIMFIKDIWMGESNGIIIIYCNHTI